MRGSLRLPPEERAAFDLPAMVENAQANAIEIVAHQRKKKAKSNSELPRRVEIIPVCETDKQCGPPPI